MKKILLILALICISQVIFSQVGINTTSPNAQLDIKSSNQATPSNTDGILIPKIDAFPITNPTVAQQGMMIYLTTISAGKQPGFYYWDNTTVNWKGLGDGTSISGWDLTGNTGTTAGTNFIGTTDDTNFVFKRNNLVSGIIDQTNTSFGNQSMQTNTSNALNTAFGSATLRDNTTGTSNVAVGAGSLIANTNGSSNVGIGADVMNRNTMGSRNVAIGNSSLESGISGTSNTAVGTESLLSASGSNNVAVGDSAGSTISIGNNNIAIGNGTDVPDGTADNQMSIGNVIYGTTMSTTALGKIGIGVPVPTEKLEVAGKTKTTNLQVTTGATIGAILVSSDVAGNGTWQNPNTALNGFTWKTTGNSGTNPATNFLGTTDNNDIVFKRFNVRAGYIGISNNSFGESALNPLSTGGSNNAFGWLSMAANTTGSQNAAFGSEVLMQNTSGDANSGFGYRVLEGNTTGHENTAFGNAAMLSNKTSNNNTAMGYRALASQSFNNGGVAYDTDNVAVGVDALYSNNPTSIINGIQNTAIGNFALTTNRTGYSNVAVGYRSLVNNVSGSGNVAIGYQAGYNEIGSNRLYIENSNSATPLIYGEFDNDLVKVNGRIKVNNVATVGNELQVKNSNIFVHGQDANLNFTTASPTSDDFMLSSKEGGFDTGGIRGDGNNVTIWAPGDDGRLVRFVDEDKWSDNNGNPYDFAAERAYIDENGQYFQVSDKNKKENVVKIENALEKISQISGYTYQFKLLPSEIEKGDKPIKSSGVLAQELEKVLPEAVQKSETGDYFVDYAAITPLLIEAIKTQNEKIKSLETINAEILKRLEKIENK
ncbi:MAG: tail fiber domain-containing protein [Flavobacterium sp.]|uniref:tail fiber domain-containing protein n=1 Tax=Flavobacterium sp. TaxID=239 RepID=UPI003266AE35